MIKTVLATMLVLGVVAAAGVTSTTQQAEAKFRWGSAIEMVKDVLPSSTFDARRRFVR